MLFKWFNCNVVFFYIKPVKTPLMQQDTEADNTTVHMAYSVTLLHHGILVHCMIPGIPWAEAYQRRPTFAIDKGMRFINDF